MGTRESLEKDIEGTSARTTLIGCLSIGVLFAGFLVVMWRGGFFTFSGSKESADLVASALALTGVFITAALSTVGVLLKQAIDRRSFSLQMQTEGRLDLDSRNNRAMQKAAEKRLRMENYHNRSLQEDAEKRLKLDTATRAIELLGTSDGHEANPLQRAGVLFTLANLGQFDLTNDLVEYLLARDSIEAPTASTLLQSALKSGDPCAQMEAIAIVKERVSGLFTDEGIELPECLVGSCGSDLCPSLGEGALKCTGLPDEARTWVPNILGAAVVSRSRDFWTHDKRRHHFYWIMKGLERYYEDETNLEDKNLAGMVLYRAWQALPPRWQDQWKRCPELVDLTVSEESAVGMVADLDNWLSSRPAS